MTNLSFNFSESPFEAIKHTENGVELWYARELMPLLGYKAWRRFNDVIQNAKENIETVVGSAFEHFLPVESKSQGRPGVDYKLSRLACYHVALCCDSRGNDAVKMAKHYFAVKTHQAEVQERITEKSTSSHALKDQYDLASFMLDDIFKNVPIKPELVAGLKLNAAKEIAPSMASILEPSRQLLIVNTAQEHALLTPTQIGERIGLSGQAVNKLLIEKGLQVKNENRSSKKEPSYLPTVKGSDFADLTLATAATNSGTFQQLRWYESVIAAIQ